MNPAWDRGHWLAFAGVVVAVVFGVPAWLVYFRDAQGEKPAAVVASSPQTTGEVPAVTQVATTIVPTEPKPEPTPVPPRSATHTFPGPYVGVIWIRIGGDGDDGVVDVSLSWGAKHRDETVDLSNGPVYLTTTKNGTDATPLRVQLDRAVEIGFGTGEPSSSATSVSVDRGWT
jgi:hypothetical protein